MSIDWKGKKILCTGSEGMIGKELVIQLNELGADITHFDIKFKADVTSSNDVEMIFNTYGPFDYCFHLFGIKGSPKMTNEKPVDFMEPMLKGDTNIITACQKYGVKRVLYTSSIAVENPQSDRFPACAKMTAETLIEAMRIQYPKTEYCIVRPSNVFGRFDNFDNPNAMVITSLISKATKPSFEVWGDGTQTRDFICAKDVAKGMIRVMNDMPKYPVNLCSGVGVQIRDIAAIISNEMESNPIFLKDKKIGEQSRIMTCTKGYHDITDVRNFPEKLKEVIEYVKNNNRNTSS